MYADRTKRIICAAAVTTFVTGALALAPATFAHAAEDGTIATEVAAPAAEAPDNAAPVARSSSDTAGEEAPSREFEETKEITENTQGYSEANTAAEVKDANDKQLDDISDDEKQTFPPVTMEGDLSINNDTTHDASIELKQDESTAIKATLDTKPIYDQTEVIYKQYFRDNDSFKDSIQLSNLKSEFYATFELGEGLAFNDKVEATYSGGNGLYKLADVTRAYNVINAHFVLNEEKANAIRTYRDLQNAVKAEGLLELLMKGITAKTPTNEVQVIKGTLNGAFRGNASFSIISMPFDFRWSGVQREGGRDKTLETNDDATLIYASYTIAKADEPVTPDTPETPKTPEKPETPVANEGEKPAAETPVKPAKQEVKAAPKATVQVMPKTSDLAQGGLMAAIATFAAAAFVGALGLRRRKDH